MFRAASHAADPRDSVCAPGVYRRRRPERTLAWQTVQTWLATWLAHDEEANGATGVEWVPAYVMRELNAYR